MAHAAPFIRRRFRYTRWHITRLLNEVKLFIRGVPDGIPAGDSRRAAYGVPRHVSALFSNRLPKLSQMERYQLKTGKIHDA